MFYFSKSKYCDFCDCPKLAWLNRYKPEEYCISDSTKARMEMGSIVGDIAMGYFGDSVEVSMYNGERLDLNRMIERTKQEIAKNTPVICEASFEYNGLYCAVDILKKENGGWAIYEVKSSTHTDKPRYINDVAYQKYVLEKCGINVTGTYVMCLNNQYIYDGKNLDIQQLFRYDDVSESVAKKLPEVEVDLRETLKEQSLFSKIKTSRAYRLVSSAEILATAHTGGTAQEICPSRMFLTCIVHL